MSTWRLPMKFHGRGIFHAAPEAGYATRCTKRLFVSRRGGQRTFNNACRTCHTTKEGDNRLGPNPHNIIGRQVGSLQNYGYSSAMKGADFVWDKEKEAP